jgi:flagellar hook-associated protein 3 FlgL
MQRISTNMPNDDMQYYLRRREAGINGIQSKIAQNTRIRELADDPLAASHAVRAASYLTRLSRFEENAVAAEDHYNHVDGFLGSANDILQKMRELAVKGANGIYTKDDTQMMGIEVNELLKELVSIANATGADGNYLFAGDKAKSEPFRIMNGTVEGIGESAPQHVEYRGAGAGRRSEISDRRFSDLDISGGEVFWAENMQIASATDASEYQVQADTSIFVDGTEIKLFAGDNVNTIAAKINDSAAPVKAFLDVQTRGLTLEGTDPHLITLEDAADSTVLRDLGIIRGPSMQGAPNWNESARVTGGSIFDVVMGLRDALLRGDHAYTGGQALGGLDMALGNLNTRRNVMGSRAERVQMAQSRLGDEILYTSEALDHEAGLDLASAALEMSMMDLAHKAALQSAAKILPPTLLDFLR